MNAATAERTGGIAIGPAAELAKRFILSTTSIHTATDDGIRGYKHGVILRRGIEIPHTITILRGDGPEGWNLKPSCPDCGAVMFETVHYRPDGPYCVWWCHTPECKAAHTREHQRIHGAERAARIDTEPEKILPIHGIPARYFRAQLDSSDADPRILRAARDWIQDPVDMYLHGGTGTGKTHLAICLLVEVIRQGGRTAFFRTPCPRRARGVALGIGAGLA